MAGPVAVDGRGKPGHDDVSGARHRSKGKALVFKTDGTERTRPTAYGSVAKVRRPVGFRVFASKVRSSVAPPMSRVTTT